MIQCDSNRYFFVGHCMSDFVNIFKFPTLTILIDDNYDFLDLFARHLFSCDLLTKYYQTESVLTEQTAYKTVSDFKELEINLVEESMLETNLSNLHKIAYSRDRFNLLSSIVVDYDMPYKNGLELCKEFKVPYVQKCILSNVMYENDVIEAFNKKEINSFMRKNERTFFITSGPIVEKMQNSFFDKITDGISNSIPILKNAEFKEFVTESAKKVNAVEMYLLDKNGSFLFLDADGKASGIISYNPLNSRFMREKAKLLSINLSEIEYFAYINLDDSKVANSNIDFYVSSISSFRPIQTDEGIYNCTFTTNEKLFINLEKEKIYPFNEYKEEFSSETFKQLFI